MSYDVDAPPILRFVLKVLDARNLEAMSAIAVEGLGQLFPEAWFALVEGDRIVSTVGVEGGPVAMEFSLAVGPPTPVMLRVQLPAGPDVAILRQQLVDLVAILRRAFADRQQLAEEQRRARKDQLTGLDNRRAISEYLDHALRECRRIGSALTVMLVDLDHFKLVNDTQGHPAGDDVLQLAASCFRAHLRPSDCVCRWGGDEFLLAIPGLRAEQAKTVAERLREAFGSATRARGTTMTIGIADSQDLVSDEDVDDLVARADACLVEAKRRGRNRTRVAVSNV